jgi:hypothetical protein
MNNIIRKIKGKRKGREQKGRSLPRNIPTSTKTTITFITFLADSSSSQLSLQPLRLELLLLLLLLPLLLLSFALLPLLALRPLLERHSLIINSPSFAVCFWQIRRHHIHHYLHHYHELPPRCTRLRLFG